MQKTPWIGIDPGRTATQRRTAMRFWASAGD